MMELERIIRHSNVAAGVLAGLVTLPLLIGGGLRITRAVDDLFPSSPEHLQAQGINRPLDSFRYRTTAHVDVVSYVTEKDNPLYCSIDPETLNPSCSLVPGVDGKGNPRILEFGGEERTVRKVSKTYTWYFSDVAPTLDERGLCFPGGAYQYVQYGEDIPVEPGYCIPDLESATVAIR